MKINKWSRQFSAGIKVSKFSCSTCHILKVFVGLGSESAMSTRKMFLVTSTDVSFLTNQQSELKVYFLEFLSTFLITSVS